MTHVIIGDVHGRIQWKKIVEKEKDADKFIFLGDYFDPYDWTLTLDDLVNNFKDILEFKTKNPDKVVLLIGNHDLAAFDGRANKCRYVDGLYEQMRPTFFNGIKDGTFQLCYFIEPNIICSHAGFTKTWLDNHTLEFNELELNSDFISSLIEDYLMLRYDFIYDKAWQDMSGDNIWQGPLWVRPRSLLQDSPEDVIQIVGHTRIRKDTPQNPIEKGILLADCLEHGEYYVVDNGIFKFNQL